MKVGVVGAGRVGTGLAKFWVDAGHEVRLSGSRDEAKLAANADQAGAGSGAVSDVAAWAEVVLLSVPWQGVEQALAQTGPLEGKVVIDATNNVSDERSSFAVIRRMVPEARLVKAFNSVFAALYDELRASGTRPEMVFCGDEDEAKAAVARLIEDAGFNPVDCGDSGQAANIESFALMVINLAYARGRGPFVYRFAKPTDI